MIITLLCSVLIIAIAFILLNVRIICLKDGNFKSQHIHDNGYLKEKRINCVIDQDKEARIENRAF